MKTINIISARRDEGVNIINFELEPVCGIPIPQEARYLTMKHVPNSASSDIDVFIFTATRYANVNFEEDVKTLIGWANQMIPENNGEEYNLNIILHGNDFCDTNDNGYPFLEYKSMQDFCVPQDRITIPNGQRFDSVKVFLYTTIRSSKICRYLNDNRGDFGNFQSELNYIDKHWLVTWYCKKVMDALQHYGDGLNSEQRLGYKDYIRNLPSEFKNMQPDTLEKMKDAFQKHCLLKGNDLSVDFNELFTSLFEIYQL